MKPDRSNSDSIAQQTARELAGVPVEPLLRVEKYLIVGSLVLGLALLGVLMWVSTAYFPISAK